MCRTRRGGLWRPEAPPFRQFRATAGPRHFKYAIPRDPARAGQLDIYLPKLKGGVWLRGPGKGRPTRDSKEVDRRTHTIAKFQNILLCHPSQDGREKSCVRFCYLEEVKGWPLPEQYLGLCYLFIDERTSSVFDEDSHLPNCECEKKVGPTPQIWKKKADGITQVVNISQRMDQANCFQPLKKGDYM